MNKTLGGRMSFNNFLSTSRNREISLEQFARPAAYKPDSVGILFVMTVDPQLCATSSIPFADVTKVGFFKEREEEILFTAHTIFRIDRIQRIQDKHTDRLWQVNLTLTGTNDNHDLHKLTSHIREELSWTRGWSRLGDILIRLGESSKAEQLYKILLDEKASSSDKDRADYNDQLGTVYDKMGEYSKALSSYERSLEIYKIALPPNHPDLATSYNNIGSVYNTGSAGFTMIYGFNNTFENNILARSSNQSDGALSLYRRESKDHLSFTFRHNIIYDIVNVSGRWIFQVQAPDPFSAPFVIMDYNCYFNIYGNMMIFGLGRLVFSEWQDTNHDMNSFITDPLFVHAENQCNFFNFSIESPAVNKLGFKPIKQLPQWKAGC
jgi:hypothetical protein